MDMDKDVLGLIDKMMTASSFVEDATQSCSFEKLKLLEDTTADLLDAITNCSNFVRKYLGSEQNIPGNRAWYIHKQA